MVPALVLFESNDVKSIKLGHFKPSPVVIFDFIFPYFTWK